MIAWSSSGIYTNIGNNYDPDTGLYTVPYDGTYAFHANIYKDYAAGNGLYCKIVLGNGTSLATASVPYTVGYYEASGSIVVHLDQGDTVAVDCDDFNKVFFYSSWMGHLVMAD